MDIKEILQQNVFVVVGDTRKEEKYAYKIKKELLENGYKVYAVGKELDSINEIEEPSDKTERGSNPERGRQQTKEGTKEKK
ncbi:hypothetical protein CG709_21165, partial [Lachnotalea glycerini]